MLLLLQVVLYILDVNVIIYGISPSKNSQANGEMNQ